jgi:RNA polymerase sigma-70 factor (ECF subfamily)
MDEKEMIARLSNGDVTVLELVYKEYADRLYSFALSICKSKEKAEDITADIFVMLYSHLSSGGTVRNLKSFLFTCTRNRAYDEWRFHSRHESLPEDDVFISETLDLSETVTLEQALGKLSSDEREIVTPYCVSGFLHREIAERLNMREGTVRWKYRGAIGKLKKLLGGDENE